MRWKLTPILQKKKKEKKITDFGYMLPNNCFTEQLSMPASEYTNKCTKRYFSLCQKWKQKKWTLQESKERKFEKKLSEKIGEQF